MVRCCTGVKLNLLMYNLMGTDAEIHDHKKVKFTGWVYRTFEAEGLYSNLNGI